MELEGAFCASYHHAIEVMGRRWTGAILRAMMLGNTRFCQIREVIPELSDTMLAARLRELEDEGIVIRTVGNERPPQVQYTLTEKGRALEPVVETLSAWAERWVPAEATPTKSAS